jgi:hypothetical protein
VKIIPFMSIMINFPGSLIGVCHFPLRIPSLLYLICLQVFSQKSAALFLGTFLSMFMHLQYLRQKQQGTSASGVRLPLPLSPNSPSSVRPKNWKQINTAFLPSVDPSTLLTPTHSRHLPCPDDLLGKWSFIYFEFMNCPDTCPPELDMTTEVVYILSSPTPTEKERVRSRRMRQNTSFSQYSDSYQ